MERERGEGSRVSLRSKNCLLHDLSARYARKTALYSILSQLFSNLRSEVLGYS